MPLIFNDVTKHYHIGIWQVTESSAFLLDHVQLDSKERQWLASIKGRGRQLEWLGARLLIKELSGKEAVHLIKDNYGKPFLADGTKHLSISHSHGYCAVILADSNVGIDIQAPVEKIRRIKGKFMNAWELHTIHPGYPLEEIHRYWSAKECLYKIYGKKQVDFRKHMTIDLANRLGYFHKSYERFVSTLYFDNVNDLYLTYAFNLAERSVHLPDVPTMP